MSEPKPFTGPDFTLGYSFAKLKDGEMLLGHADGEHVLLARRGDDVFAVGASCTHYGALLTDGIIDGDTVRCPWHHACFSLRTGEAVAAPAFTALPRWDVQRDGDALRLGARTPEPPPRPAPVSAPQAIVIIGAGAAGMAAANMLRREGYRGAVTMISAEPHPPVDRPNLSKDFLAGGMPESWLWVLADTYYSDHQIELISGVRVEAIHTAERLVTLADGRRLHYDALLLATGANPIHLQVPGADLPHVHYLRTLADSRGIAAASTTAKRAVVVGASFIGLEVAASLRARGVEVHVVAPDQRPLERILGPEIGDFIRALHETHGVTFHLGTKPQTITADTVTLENGERIGADLVVVGVGVRPAVELAEQAGLAVDKGVTVDQYLQTSVAGIYAAGDIARYPSAQTGDRVRIEHWDVAQWHGQTAARNMLGRREAYTAVPFFWSAHYDVTMNYVGHAERWDRIDIDGSIQDRDCTLRYMADGEIRAVLTIFRDKDSLHAAVAMSGATQ